MKIVKLSTISLQTVTDNILFTGGFGHYIHFISKSNSILIIDYLFTSAGNVLPQCLLEFLDRTM